MKLRSKQTGGIETMSTWRVPGTRITIARVEEGPQKHEYLLSPGTASRAVSSYHNISSEPYRTTGPAVSKGFYNWYVSVPGNRHVGSFVQLLPERLRQDQTLGMANWKWIGVLITLTLGRRADGNRLPTAVAHDPACTGEECLRLLHDDRLPRDRDDRPDGGQVLP